MAATDVGILFLDSELRINRFTPRTHRALQHRDRRSKAGSITDFTHQARLRRPRRRRAQGFARSRPQPSARSAARPAIGISRGCRPYRTVEDKIDGVVVTFVDIGERRRAADALQRKRSSGCGFWSPSLQHRTRNLIGIVMAIVDRSAVTGQSARRVQGESSATALWPSRASKGFCPARPPGDGVAFDELLELELSAQSGRNGGSGHSRRAEGRRSSGQSRFKRWRWPCMNSRPMPIKYGALSQRRASQYPMVGGSGRGLALDQHRLERNAA